MSILADANPVFQRAMRIVSTITNANPAVVTTTFDHQYLTGLIVRLNIPKGYGMTQANRLYGPIVVTGATTFTVDIDTTHFDTFIVPIVIDTTDGAGAASGTISGITLLTGLGQTFTIGTQIFTVTATSGALTTSGVATGTMNMTTGAYTFTGATALTDVYWNPISFPFNQQYPQVLPTAEQSDTLLNATQNILPL